MSDQQLLAMQQRASNDPAPPGAWGPYSTPAQTLVIGNHLRAPCNCATASPDGQWIAAVGDAPLLHLLHISEGYGMGVDPKKPGVKKQGGSKGAVLKFSAKQPGEMSRNNRDRADSSTGFSGLRSNLFWDNVLSVISLQNPFFGFGLFLLGGVAQQPLHLFIVCFCIFIRALPQRCLLCVVPLLPSSIPSAAPLPLSLLTLLSLLRSSYPFLVFLVILSVPV